MQRSVTVVVELEAEAGIVQMVEATQEAGSASDARGAQARRAEL